MEAYGRRVVQNGACSCESNKVDKCRIELREVVLGVYVGFSMVVSPP